MTASAWRPDGATLAAANTTALASRFGCGGYDELHAVSVAEPERFWEGVVDQLGLVFDEPYARVLQAGDGMEWPRWFVGGRLNAVTSCLDRHVDEGRGTVAALVCEHEDGTVERLTYRELRDRSARLAAGLAELGVGLGDRVALVLPMRSEVAVGFYAAARLGAIVVPIFSGFSTQAIASRLEASGATAVLTATTSSRRGREIPLAGTVVAAAVQAGTPHVVVHGGAEGAHDWRRIERADARVDRPVPVESEHPLMIAYTSGTTGRPKGAVHVHAGFLAKIAEEVHVQADVRRGDSVCWLTDMGWIMGPWELIGAHALGATLVFYDGTPDFPDWGRIWRLVEDHGITFLGVSPTLIRALAPQGSAPSRLSDLGTLRAFGSTGEPWNPEPYRFLFEEIGEGTRPIVNLSGGTEVGACFLSCDVTLPTKPCSLGRPALGMALDVYDPEGRSLMGTGDVGELVCTAPWPSQTRGVWGDPERYRETYFTRYPGVWTHGDWASVDADGDWFLHGRSDDTMNVAGKRIGPAEYESALVGHPLVVEACAVAVPHAVKGESAYCYCVISAEPRDLDALRAELVARIDDDLGKAFRPTKILIATALPKTRSAKIVRRAVRAIAVGDDVGDTSSIEDPGALEAIRAAR